MLITNFDRIKLLALLGQQGTVAEVGVYRGGFASSILRVVSPNRLHLIDPWARDELDRPDIKRVGGGYQLDAMLQAYDGVQDLFKHEVAAGQVMIHRDYSTPAAAHFPDHTFDWVYIDAMHNYQDVLADLSAYADKVKPGGFLLGHDFSNTVRSRVKQNGVVRAVREFVARGDFTLVLITNEAAPSYLLARSDNTTTLPLLRQTVISQKGCIDIDESYLDLFSQVEVKSPNGRMRQLMRFG